MNKWLVLILFYAVLAMSLAQANSAWVRAAWLAPFLLLAAASWVAALRHSWKQRHAADDEWQPGNALWRWLPASWQRWMLGE